MLFRATRLLPVQLYCWIIRSYTKDPFWYPAFSKVEGNLAKSISSVNHDDKVAVKICTTMKIMQSPITSTTLEHLLNIFPEKQKVIFLDTFYFFLIVFWNDDDLLLSRLKMHWIEFETVNMYYLEIITFLEEDFWNRKPENHYELSIERASKLEVFSTKNTSATAVEIYAQTNAIHSLGVKGPKNVQRVWFHSCEACTSI